MKDTITKANQHFKMKAPQPTRYRRPMNYANTYLSDRQALLWNHKKSNTWVIATYNKEMDTFTGIYSWGEIFVNTSLNQIGLKMTHSIGRDTCNAWAEFKTLAGDSIERLDL